MTSRLETGRLGELAARRHLESIGYRIVAANVRAGRHEIDIVAEHDETLVFVEVRTRRGRAMGSPEESITSRKSKGMLAAAQSYLASKRQWNREWRIDLVAVEFDRLSRVSRLTVIRNALEE